MKNLYIIHDRIADDLVSMHMYTIMNFHTDAEATRYFADAINDQKSILNKHPGDYELIKVGTINNHGLITPADPQLIITGDSILALSTQEEH